MIARTLALVLAICLVGCKTEHARPDAPSRPAKVPASAVWAGGVDGGAFIDCKAKDEARLSYFCTVYDDSVGDEWAKGDYTLVRSRWVEAEKRAAHDPLEAPPAKLTFTGFDGETIFLEGSLVMILSAGAPPTKTGSVTYKLPSPSAHDEAWYRDRVAAAEKIAAAFAAAFGWSDRMRTFWRGGVEIFAHQNALWRRVLELHDLPRDTKLPTKGLAAGLEKNVLLVVTPEAYASIQPEYAKEEASYDRLIAHEMVHRLHVSILDGDEDAMGPTWFYEGFAVVGSGALEGAATATPENLADFKSAKGPGAYAKFAAALRYYRTCAPLPELVANAKRPDLDAWLNDRCVKAGLPHRSP